MTSVRAAAPARQGAQGPEESEGGPGAQGARVIPVDPGALTLSAAAEQAIDQALARLNSAAGPLSTHGLRASARLWLSAELACRWLEGQPSGPGWPRKKRTNETAEAIWALAERVDPAQGRALLLALRAQAEKLGAQWARELLEGLSPARWALAELGADFSLADDLVGCSGRLPLYTGDLSQVGRPSWEGALQQAMVGEGPDPSGADPSGARCPSGIPEPLSVITILMGRCWPVPGEPWNPATATGGWNAQGEQWVLITPFYQGARSVLAEENAQQRLRAALETRSVKRGAQSEGIKARLSLLAPELTLLTLGTAASEALQRAQWAAEWPRSLGTLRPEAERPTDLKLRREGQWPALTRQLAPQTLWSAPGEADWWLQTPSGWWRWTLSPALERAREESAEMERELDGAAQALSEWNGWYTLLGQELSLGEREWPRAALLAWTAALVDQAPPGDALSEDPSCPELFSHQAGPAGVSGHWPEGHWPQPQGDERTSNHPWDDLEWARTRRLLALRPELANEDSGNLDELKGEGAHPWSRQAQHWMTWWWSLWRQGR